ncbi:MAG TPA: LDL receptor domain-containing protein [Polyangiaceae bacterium]|nr:LDL receptor domain-containing protein [Polyangiaceae bacterium]
MRAIVVLIGFASFFGVVACSDDEDSAPQVCEDLANKLRECNLATMARCNADTSEDLLCAAQCMVDADCAQLTGPVEDNSYYRCVVICSGGTPDSFLCADGAGFVPPAAVCDGTAQCPDGSDEAECSEG